MYNVDNNLRNNQFNSTNSVTDIQVTTNPNLVEKTDKLRNILLTDKPNVTAAQDITSKESFTTLTVKEAGKITWENIFGRELKIDKKAAIAIIYRYCKFENNFPKEYADLLNRTRMKHDGTFEYISEICNKLPRIEKDSKSDAQKSQEEQMYFAFFQILFSFKGSTLNFDDFLKIYQAFGPIEEGNPSFLITMYSFLVKYWTACHFDITDRRKVRDLFTDKPLGTYLLRFSCQTSSAVVSYIGKKENSESLDFQEVRTETGNTMSICSLEKYMKNHSAIFKFPNPGHLYLPNALPYVDYSNYAQ